MNKPVLVVMAAGMGSRFGGLKQIEPIGPNGELIIEYSIYDAIKAGFGKIVFIIKREMLDIFKDVIGNKVENFIDVEYILQEINNVPVGFKVNEERIKPWGTGHAILCCKDIVKEPFAVINADDYYGQATYKIMADYLINNNKINGYAMAGFVLEKTLTEAGTVARGICTLDEENNLVSVEERTQIMKVDDKSKYTLDGEMWFEIPERSIVSMNLWGFTGNIFQELETGFIKFLEEIELGKRDELKAEYYLPSLVNDLLVEKKAEVKVLETDEQWFGVTYKEDKENVKLQMQKLMGSKYPKNLWEEFN